MDLAGKVIQETVDQPCLNRRSFPGQDATSGFEDVGHSADAREQLAPLLIGELPEVGPVMLR